MAHEKRERLRSWKQIARFLGRDIRTAMRWENRGMPVHRIPGGRKGTSVYAFTDELDAWMEGAPTQSPHAGRRVGGLVVVAGLAVLAASPLLVSKSSKSPVASHAAVEGPSIVGYDAAGELAWTYSPPSGASYDELGARIVMFGGGATKALYVAANSGVSDLQGGLHGALSSLTPRGELRWELQLDEQIGFAEGEFGPPWISGPMEVYESRSGRRILWGTHHSTWWPSQLLVIDDRGVVQDRFVSAGWILLIHVAPATEGDRLLVAGIDNERAGAMLAVLDADYPSGSVPSTADSPFGCETCPEGRPLAYFVLSPSHVSSASDLPYNRTVQIRSENGDFSVVTREEDGSDAHWIYRLTTDLRVVSARPGDSYWNHHRRLRLQGLIDHDEEACPERVERTILAWSPGEGWQTLHLPVG